MKQDYINKQNNFHQPPIKKSNFKSNNNLHSNKKIAIIDNIKEDSSKSSNLTSKRSHSQEHSLSNSLMNVNDLISEDCNLERTKSQVVTTRTIKTLKTDGSNLTPSNKTFKPKPSLNQKRRWTYLNYRNSINIVNNSKRQSAVEFQTIQKAVEKSYKKSNFEEFTGKLKLYEFTLGVLAFINIILSLLDTQLYISRFDVYKINKGSIVEMIKIENDDLSIFENVLRYIMMLISLSMGFLVFLKYLCILNLKKTDKVLSVHDNLLTSGDYKFLLIETVISIIFYPPNFSGVYHDEVNQFHFIIITNAIFSLLTILKFYHVIRVYKYISKFENFDSNSICNKYGVKANFIFAFKAEIKYRPFIALSIVFFFFILLMSFSLRTFENGIFLNEAFLDYKNLTMSNFNSTFHASEIPTKGTQNLDFFANSLWFIIVTITTVGYGDAYPKTHFGRAVSAISCIFGIFLISLITASLSTYTQFNSVERKAYLTLKQLQQEKEINYKAHSVIKNILEIYRSSKIKQAHSKFTTMQSLAKETSKKKSSKMLAVKSKNDKKLEKEKQERINKLANQFVLLAQLRKNITNFKLEDRLTNKVMPLDELLLKMRKKLKSDLYKLETNVNQLQILNSQFKELKQGHIDNDNKIKNIISKQTSILNYILKVHNKKFQNNFLTKFHPSIKKSRKNLSPHQIRNTRSSIKPLNNEEEDAKVAIKNYFKKSLKDDSIIQYYIKSLSPAQNHRKSKFSYTSEFLQLSEVDNRSIDLDQSKILCESIAKRKSNKYNLTSKYSNEIDQQVRKVSQNSHSVNSFRNRNYYNHLDKGEEFGLNPKNLFADIKNNYLIEQLNTTKNKNLKLNLNLNFNFNNINRHFYTTKENDIKIKEIKEGKESINIKIENNTFETIKVDNNII
jgi:hypothetical protein